MCQLKARKPDTLNAMEIAVWDTYFSRKDGRLMHFDIMVPVSVRDESIIFQYGKEYLEEKGEVVQKISSKECKFCHIEEANSEYEQAISEKGYFIFEMENCD